MNNREFELPAPPWPEHTQAVDKLLVECRYRLLGIATRSRQHTFMPHLKRGYYGKLNDDDRAAIVELGYTLTAAEIGELYGVCSYTVNRIRSRAGLDGKRMGGLRRRKKGH